MNGPIEKAEIAIVLTENCKQPVRSCGGGEIVFDRVVECEERCRRRQRRGGLSRRRCALKLRTKACDGDGDM